MTETPPTIESRSAQQGCVQYFEISDRPCRLDAEDDVTSMNVSLQRLQGDETEASPHEEFHGKDADDGDEAEYKEEFQDPSEAVIRGSQRQSRWQRRLPWT